MAINISQDFKRTSAAPIDATLVLTKAEMLAVDDNLMPDKYFAVCKDDGKFYIYDKSATAGAETGKFSVLEGGGSGDTYTLPPATASTLGGVKIGDGVTVDTDGTISVDAGGDDQDLESVLTTGNIAKNKWFSLRDADGSTTSALTTYRNDQVVAMNSSTGKSAKLHAAAITAETNNDSNSRLDSKSLTFYNGSAYTDVLFSLDAKANTCTVKNDALKTAIKNALDISGGSDQDINSVLAAGNTAKNKTLLMRNANGDATSHYVNVSEAMVSGGNPTTNNTFAISGSQVLLTRNGATSNAVSHTGMSVKNAAGTVQFEINANSNTCTIGNTTLKNAMRTALGITDGTTYTAGDGIDITNDEISVTFATDAEIDEMLTNIFGA